MKTGNFTSIIMSYVLGLTLVVMLCITGCSRNSSASSSDFSGFEFLEGEETYARKLSPGSQEDSYSYKTYFIPSIDGIKQPYVGDTMPYYEDGVYYIYYLKDGGDSYNHSVYLVTTEDFVNYQEQDEAVLVSSKSGGQDGWIGTGSVIKIDGTYYFFYTGHASGPSEFGEKIMVAKSDNLRSFDKVDGWSIAPDSSLGQKRDFRDPQAYLDPQTGRIVLTVTASKSGDPRILKYSMDKSLSDVKFEGIIFTDTVTDCYNLECSDTFQIGNKYYLTYSAQDDTLWYAVSDKPYEGYSNATRIEGKLFYAAKHVENNGKYYMVGWGRRSESPSSVSDVSAWAGNLVVQEIIQNPDGTLALVPVEALEKQYTEKRKIYASNYVMESGSLYDYQEMFMAYENYMLKGQFEYSGKGNFGLAFDYGKEEGDYKMISISPKKKTVSLLFNGGKTAITEVAVDLVPNTVYSFTYIQDGSVGVFYIDGKAALTVRLYGVSGKPVRLYAENNTVKYTNLVEFTRK